VVLLVGLGAIFLFAGAELSVTPKQGTAFVDGTFAGMQTQTATSSTPSGILPYSILTTADVDTSDVPATGQENVSLPASGHIVVYNNYSTSPQQLIKNTRFATPEGLIYRIHDSISVPGMTTVNGQKTPGSIEVTVYADQPGDTYNIGLTDFTVPGFKGSPQYTGFYARSKTPMTGGFVGMRPVVATSTEATAVSTIQNDLRTKLVADAKSKIPEGYILPDKGTFVTFDDPTQSTDSTSTSNVTLSIQGTLHGILIKNTDLAGVIASKNLPSYDDAPVMLTNPGDLSIEPVIDPSVTNPWDQPTLDFAVKGNAALQWVIDTKRLASDLAGKSESALNTVLTGYPGVDRAKAIFRPVWRSTFPTNPDDINITFEQAASSTP
jgi:hypothetical protein